MTKLIVEEGGQRREFRIGDGALTIGSGDGAKLRLSSPDVAEIHLELEVEGDRGHVRARPGVSTPQISGVPITGTGTLDPGQVLQVGSARLWLEAEPGLGPIGAAPAAAEAKPAPARPRSVVQVRQHRPRRSLPLALIIALVLVGIGVVVAVLASVFRRQSELGAGPVWASIQAAEEQLEAGNLDLAELKLRIRASRTLTPEERERISALRDEIAGRREATDLILLNMRGSKYLDVRLKKYETKWLSGSPEPAKVRLFLQRCREFCERWPQHEGLDWVGRQESRFLGFVDLRAAPTWDDIAWEIRYLAGQKPRNYRQAFALLDEFMTDARGSELLEADELRQRLIVERVEYHRDRIYQAEFEFNRKENASLAVWWLLHSVIWIGDAEMADEAAGYLLKIPDLEVHLLGYRKTYPDRYQAVLQHPLVREFAREKGLPE